MNLGGLDERKYLLLLGPVSALCRWVGPSSFSPSLFTGWLDSDAPLVSVCFLENGRAGDVVRDP